MSTYTTNYNLIKPEYSDDADIMDINGNMDVVDGELKDVSDMATANATAISELGTTVDGLTSAVSGLSTGKQDILTRGTVAANTDLNTVAVSGYYWLNSAYGNLPHSGTGSGVLEVIAPSSLVVMQTYTRFQTANYAVSNIFFRLRVNGTWYPWKTALTVN